MYDSNLHSKSNVYVIKHWITAKKNDVYVFSDDKTHQKNSLYKDKNTRNIHYINRIISDGISIQHLKYMICKYCKISLNDEYTNNLYLWGGHNANNDYLIYFLKSLFVKCQNLSSKTILNIISMFFDLSHQDEKNILKDSSFLTVFETLKYKQMYRTIGFTYLDLNDNIELLNPNPFSDQHSNINEKDLRTKSHENTILYTTDITNVINVISKGYDGHDTIKTLYFPNLNEPGNKNSFDIRENFQQDFESHELKIHNWSHKTIYMILRVLPYTHDLNLNLLHVFNNITTNINMPLVLLRDRGTNTYKVNQKYLNTIDKQIIDNIKKQNDKSVNIRNNSTLLCFFNINTLGFILVLSRNGSYKIKYLFKKHYSAQIDEIKQSFDVISPLLKTIDDVNLHIINNETDIFNSPFIEISDYSTNSVISLLDNSIDGSLLISNLKQCNLLFDFVSKNANIIMLKFREVSNFYNIDSVSNLIYKNRELSDGELIELLQVTFGLSQTDAENELAEKKSKININYTRKGNNIFALRDHHTSVNIKLNIISDSAIRVITTNTQHLKYVERLVMYLIYMSQNDVSNIGLNTKKYIDKIDDKKNTDNVRYDDILENYDEEFDLSAFEDIGLDDTFDERPSLNRETNEDILTAEPDEIDEIKSTVGIAKEYHKNDYTQNVLKKLQAADPLLFKWTPTNPEDKKANYSGKCGAVNYRQPVVINKSEKENIDKNFPNSYTGYVQTGSTEELKNKNYYICPKIWCRVSRVSLSDDDLKKLNHKCPSGEEPLFFPKKGIKTNYFINRMGEEIHYPILMDKSKHPQGLEMPCCGKSVPKNVQKNETGIYISKISNKSILDNEKYGVLPNSLDKILNQGKNCVGIIDKTKYCFVRMGTNPNKDSLLDCFERIYDVNDFVSYTCDNLSLESYLFHNHGHTLKTFIDDYEVSKIYEVSEFEIFKKGFISSKRYIKQFNLQSVVDILKTMSIFKLKAGIDANYGIIMRQFLIFRSFSNFKKYFTSDIFQKRIEDVVDLVNYLPTPNKKYLNVLFLNFDDTDIFLINSKYTNIFKTFNFDNDTALIVKINNKFEPITKITSKTKSYSFSFEQIAPFLNMIFKNTTNRDNENSFKYGKDIQKYVMTMDFKIRGFIREESKIIPLHAAETIQYKYIYNKSFVFIDQLQDYELDWSLSSEFNIDNAMKQELDNTYFNKKYNKLNFKLFVSTFENNGNTNEDTITYELTKTIQKNKQLVSDYNILIHELAHFTMKEKCSLLKQFLKTHKIKGESLSNHILHKLLTIDIPRFQHYYMNNKMLLSDEEVLLSQEDILKGELDTIYESVFKTIFQQKVTIEDFTNTITQIKL
tara:strand:+ start:19346 stop:23374 length:4029 start_codon:yes stop_codon:yes gene_type:complete